LGGGKFFGARGLPPKIYATRLFETKYLMLPIPFRIYLNDTNAKEKEKEN